MDGWDGRDPGWSGPPADEMAKWGTRDAPMNPHGMPGKRSDRTATFQGVRRKQQRSLLNMELGLQAEALL